MKGPVQEYTAETRRAANTSPRGAALDKCSSYIPCFVETGIFNQGSLEVGVYICDKF